MLEVREPEDDKPVVENQAGSPRSSKIPMTNETNEQTHPTNKTLPRQRRRHPGLCEPTAEVVNLVHEPLPSLQVLPVQPNRPMHTEGIISRSDGALVCLEYRFAATPEHLETQPSTVPCRYCGRPVSGGRPGGARTRSSRSTWVRSPTMSGRCRSRPRLSAAHARGCVPPVSEKQPVKTGAASADEKRGQERTGRNSGSPPKPALAREREVGWFAESKEAERS